MLQPFKRAILQSLERVGFQISRARDPIELQRELLSQRAVRTIFDVGANVGNVTAKYRSAFPSARVYAFEPFPGCVATMHERFDTDPRIEIVPTGVAEASGAAKLRVAAGKSTHSLLVSQSYAKSQVTEEIEIPLTTIDEFVAEHDVGDVQILKIDVEGAEDRVIRGAERLLRAGCVDVVMLEVMFVPHFKGQRLFHELTTQLAGLGYSLFDIPQMKRAKTGQLRWGDAIYVSHQVRALLKV